MHASTRLTGVPFLASVVMLACAWSIPAAAADESWWQRIDGQVVIGVAAVRAQPDSGGVITASFNDSGTAGVDKTLRIEGGRDTRDYLPTATLGARFRQTERFNWGLELQGSSFSDAFAGTARDAAGTTPLANFATYREESLFKMEAADLSAVASYSRWNLTAEGTVGLRSGTFEARSESYTFGVFTTGNFINLNLSNGSSFKGDGLVYGTRLGYAIPRLPLSLFARYKYSKLDGKSDSFGSSAGTVASSPSAPLVGAATVRRNDADSNAKINELELGLQYDFAAGARLSSFARVSYTRTTLKLDGPATGGAGFGGTIGTLTTNSFASGGLGEGELSGVAFAVGVKF